VGSRAKRRLLIAGIVVVALLALGVVGVVVYSRRNVPQRFAGIADQFKYGSIGSEARAGVPYWIWIVLPKVFPDYLPTARPGSGYEKIGFLTEPGKPRPIGTTYRESPIGMVGLNCAVCHTATIRDSATSPPQIVFGLGANQFDLQAYLTLLRKAGQDKRFNADTLLAAIRKENPKFSWVESLAYRYFVIPRTKKALVQLNRDFAWMDSRPDLGPGRVDTFNPYKVYLGMDISRDTSIGTVHLPSLWNQAIRRAMSLHWDGNNSSLEERNKSAAIGAGASPDSLDLASMKRIEDWILTLQPPAFPKERINPTLAAAGKPIYEANCGSCHAVGGAQVGKVLPLTDIGTDPARLNSFTADLAQKMNTIGQGKPWHFSHFTKTNGYANMPLDGVWLRAPYLHNGSVPTLRALLFPDQRPATFFTGYDVYDYTNLGFVSSGPEAQAQGFRFDTSLPGNGNGGHLYGTQLSAQDREALLEYMKSL
jgi:mono/diheme cytochrome c family protein